MGYEKKIRRQGSQAHAKRIRFDHVGFEREDLSFTKKRI
jgi:hypothetical protein